MTSKIRIIRTKHHNNRSRCFAIILRETDRYTCRILDLKLCPRSTIARVKKGFEDSKSDPTILQEYWGMDKDCIRVHIPSTNFSRYFVSDCVGAKVKRTVVSNILIQNYTFVFKIKKYLLKIPLSTKSNNFPDFFIVLTFSFLQLLCDVLCKYCLNIACALPFRRTVIYY